MHGFGIGASMEPKIKSTGCLRLEIEGENPVGERAEIDALRKEVQGLRADMERLTRIVALSRADYERVCDLFRQSYERELDRVDRAVAELRRAATNRTNFEATEPHQGTCRVSAWTRLGSDSC